MLKINGIIIRLLTYEEEDNFYLPPLFFLHKKGTYLSLTSYNRV